MTSFDCAQYATIAPASDKRRASPGHRLALAALATVLVAAGSVSASAGGRGSAGDYVVAESKFGNGTVIGPVRHTSVGRQVKTPGGSWIYCERSCSETLRVNTVDFWQSRQGAGPNGAIDQQDGLLSPWLRWRRGY